MTASLRLLRVTWSATADATCAALHGALDIDAIDVLAAVAVVASDHRPLVIDLADVTFIDVAGLRILRQLARIPSVRCAGSSAAVARLLDLVGEPDALEPLVS